MPLVDKLQVAPLQCRMVPPSPTAKTSVPDVPQTPLSQFVMPLVIALQAVPL